MKMKRFPIFGLAAGVAILGFLVETIHVGTALCAEDKYPSRAIEIWCGFGPGGKTDMNTRVLAKGLERVLQVPVVAGNKPGAGTTIAAAALAHSAPDGYKLAVLGDSGLIISVLLGNATYKLDDLCVVAKFNSDAQAIAVNADTPWKTVKDFISYAREKPGLNFGHFGLGTTLQLRADYFCKLANIKTVGIPFKSDPEMAAAILGKHVDIGMASFFGAMPHVAAGKMRILFNFNDPGLEPFPEIPNIPSYFGKDVYNFGPVANYLVAPASTPKHIIKRLEDAVEKVVTTDTEFIESHKKMYLAAVFANSETCSNIVKKDTIEHKRLMQELGLIK